MNVSEMGIVELKALAYDTIARLEQCKLELNQINQLIAKKVEDERIKESAKEG